MNFPSAVKANAWRFALAAIIMLSASLSLYWVFLVPILESPDEQTHIDYAFNIYSAGRPISIREPPQDCNIASPGYIWHVYTYYLIGSSNLNEIHANPEGKVEPNYGTRAYFDELDRNALVEMSGDVGSRPKSEFPKDGFVGTYPFGYYAVLAAWMGILQQFSGRLTVLFFGGRILSVILLALSGRRAKNRPPTKWSVATTAGYKGTRRLRQTKSVPFRGFDEVVSLTGCNSCGLLSRQDNLLSLLLSCFFIGHPFSTCYVCDVAYYPVVGRIKKRGLVSAGPLKGLEPSSFLDASRRYSKSRQCP
jgi:hypothetical protein